MNKWLYLVLLFLIVIGSFLLGITFAFEGLWEESLFAVLWVFIALIFLTKKGWKNRK